MTQDTHNHLRSGNFGATKGQRAHRRTRRRTLVDIAVAACLAGTRVATVYAAPEDDTDTLQEITVTAQRRSEDLQRVPIAVQAMTSEIIEQLHIENFEDVAKQLPNLTLGSSGPGQGFVYMRGLSTGVAGGVQGSGGVGEFPNVAVYLDDQSASLPSRNLDIYAADLERIEVLEGPQGTLFGAGAQAGVVRYITNKPKLNVVEGNVNAGYGTTAHGAQSSNVDATLNLPLITDTLAVRGVIYDDTRGGYINNVPGTFVRQSTDLGIHYAGYTNNIPGPATPLNSVNNFNMTGKDINPVTYKGIRVEALWKINEDWNALVSQSYQDLDSQGVFFETPVSSGTGDQSKPLPDLSVQLYNPSYNHDSFTDTALTINGHIGALDIVYSGSYLVRTADQVQDYTNYARGAFTDYYQCVPGNGTTTQPQCYSPSATWFDIERAIHQSHELRLSTPDDWRLRGIVGLFWENFVIHDETEWNYKTAPGFTDIGPPPGASVSDPSIRPSNDAFFNDITRGYKQRAAFTSIDFDLIPKTLTLTAGTRYYRFDNSEVGAAVSSFGCYNTEMPPPCLAGANNLNDRNLRSTYTGTRSRVNLTWRVTPDVMVYYTFSQGFRPGGFNRATTNVPNLNFTTPQGFAPDTLTNNEIGAKSEWFDHRLQFNLAAYHEKWTNVQVQFYDPYGLLGNQGFETNGPNYVVRGVETQIEARATRELTFNGSASWNSSSMTNSPFLVNNAGQPITEIKDPFGVTGDSLAMSPPFQANARIRYEFVSLPYQPFFQLGMQHSAHSHSGTGYAPNNFEQPGWTQYDVSSGVSRGDWSVQAYCDNFTDHRSLLYINNYQWVLAETVSRPRTAGLKFSYKFKGS